VLDYQFGMVAAVDVSNPASPQIVSVFNDATIVGARSITIEGDTAFVVNDRLILGQTQYLTAIDVSNLADLKILGRVADSGKIIGPRDVTVAGNTAFVASLGSDSLTVIDVSIPANPQIVGHITDSVNLDRPYSVTIAGNTAIVAHRKSDSLTLIDISAYSQLGIETPLKLMYASGETFGTITPSQIPDLKDLKARLTVLEALVQQLQAQ
jgi:uncharacterized secreted protein with C-terminal beta-propeller domain